MVDRFSGMNSLISSYLTASGFDVRCMQSVDGITAEALSSAHLVLMDIDTAGDRLSEIAGRLSASGIPLVVLTSEHDSDGRLTALEMGAAVRGLWRSLPPGYAPRPQGRCWRCRS